MPHRLWAGRKGGRGYSRWWKQHEQQDDGGPGPAAVGASFVQHVEDGTGCIMAGLGRAVGGGSLYQSSGCLFSQRIEIPLESMQLYSTVLMNLAFAIWSEKKSIMDLSRAS